jgi:hypothetical protein
MWVNFGEKKRLCVARDPPPLINSFSHISPASERARTQPAPETDGPTDAPLACPGKSIFQANYVPPIAQPSHRENMRAAGNPL